MRRLSAGSVSGHRAADETAKCPEPLCPMSIVTSSGRRVPPPGRALPLRPRSYGLMRQSPPALPSFGLSLVRGVFAGCYQPRLRVGSSRRYLCESFLGCSAPYHGGTPECFCLFLPLVSSAFPRYQLGRLPASFRQNDFSAGTIFEAAGISLCSGLQVCLPPRSFLPLLDFGQGSRGFYVRAEHASLPPHASDMLAIRIQAIDGAGTCAPQDSQPCRLLLTPSVQP